MYLVKYLSSFNQNTEKYMSVTATFKIGHVGHLRTDWTNSKLIRQMCKMFQVAVRGVPPRNFLSNLDSLSDQNI